MLTLAEVLQLDVLLKANAEVLAAEHRLNRTVSWVHISEMERLAHLFHGGELLLTQGRGIPKSPSKQEEWVDALADVDIAGIAIEKSFALDDVPKGLIEQAQRRQLPLIGMTRPAYFMEITRAVHSAIVSNQHDALLHAEHLGKRLSRLVMSGGTLQDFMDEVASVLSHPVVLTGPTYMVQAYSPRNQQTLSKVSNWRTHTKHGHETPLDMEPAISETPDGNCLYQPIIYQGETWGCLHVLIEDFTPTQLTFRSLDRAVTLIGPAYAVERSISHLGTDVRSKLIQDLLSAASTNAKELQERLHWVGFDPSVKVRVLIAEPIDPNPRVKSILNERRRTESLLALIRKIEQSLGRRVLVGGYGTRVAAIVPEDCEIASLQSFSTETGDTAVIGCSSISDLTSLVGASRVASEALKYALQLGQTQGVYRAEDLVLERILMKLDEDGVLKEIVEGELGLLLDHDSHSRSPLLDTLEALFECGGRKSDVAKALHIDRRTAYHRLARIEKILGDNWSHPDKQLTLNLAIRGLRFMRGRIEAFRRWD